MGKPFSKELDLIEDTYRWATDQDVSQLKKLADDRDSPVLIVGSGGSLSACYFAVYLLQNLGIMAKAVTPLELYYSRNALAGSRVLFISASGKNSDILFALSQAIEYNPRSITTVCMRHRTPLARLASGYSISETIEYKLPSGKDGFLATNSLVAYFAILRQAFDLKDSPLDLSHSISFEMQVKEFLDQITPFHTLTVLYGGWGHPVAIDLESKFTEAALGNVQIADYRNFAHGRHHWFAKRAEQSAILALVTPEEELIASKTLSILPASILKLKVATKEVASLGSIDLLIKIFVIVNVAGQQLDIDPGRPGVPEFGRRLYNLKYSSLFEKKKIHSLQSRRSTKKPLLTRSQ
jgi:glucosamine 6-phosphate synthetase-like amidotransferase/phosphosugar isomerase protein